MVRRLMKVTLLLLIAMVVCACAELPGEEADKVADLPMLEVGSQDSVPEGWGSLVAVSNSTAFPELFQLWFQDEAGNIHMVVFDDRTRTLKPKSVLIKRH